ncbi:glycerophosphoryl diester phosphodiesterase [Renibacterium salmoninarum ATCC 33209]|uniref:Glycerophosphoryl diester phosphodiesterase n=1 Tax=Renibacterium salmoninarum (strain ATCC 33209 / DSM 20767 / JCM 11484 / NBRC 15589 / NCIMB 2235) TaxID=288705 RepID=A9WUH3_RENSM|nr:glycerophosphoryl diester phosphodiesterase [Renibacterium salmoninarum ATCC 33209]
MLLHDSTVDRTSNGTGAVAEHALAQLRELDFRSWKGVDVPDE